MSPEMIIDSTVMYYGNYAEIGKLLTWIQTSGIEPSYVSLGKNFKGVSDHDGDLVLQLKLSTVEEIAILKTGWM